VTSSVAVFKAAIQVKSMHMIKSYLKPEKKRQYGNKRKFYINLHLNDRLDIEFVAF